MRIFSLLGAGKPLDRSKALTCLLVNQFATPGLGSLMAGRIVEGSVQLIFAIVGFVCVVGWFVQVVYVQYQTVTTSQPVATPYPWLGQVGGIIFFASWLLSWITSLSLMRNAKKNDPNLPPPPRPPIIQ
jgi:hypothetical protein